MADVAQLGRVATRLHSRLLERSLGTLGEGGAEVARRGLSALGASLRALCETITAVVRPEERCDGKRH
jgi:hypothetical protein